jgi:hypothetical protein
MGSSFLIIGIKLSKETIAISSLIIGIILQIIYRKMKKDENFSQEENLK